MEDANQRAEEMARKAALAASQGMGYVYLSTEREDLIAACISDAIGLPALLTEIERMKRQLTRICAEVGRKFGSDLIGSTEPNFVPGDIYAMKVVMKEMEARLAKAEAVVEAAKAFDALWNRKGKLSMEMIIALEASANSIHTALSAVASPQAQTQTQEGQR